MTMDYLNLCLNLSYAAPQQDEFQLSPGDGFKDLLPSPIWS
jgi:hypothetical protein